MPAPSLLSIAGDAVVLYTTKSGSIPEEGSMKEEQRQAWFNNFIESVSKITMNVLSTSEMDANFSARQIVDDAIRVGIDIRFQQHLVEAILLGTVRPSDRYPR